MSWTDKVGNLLRQYETDSGAAQGQNNASLVDSVSNFYAQHKGLVKTLGGGALVVVLARIAEKQRESART
jgi:hypothetical protein